MSRSTLPPAPDVDRLSDLDALHRRVQAAIASAGETLIWFADRFEKTGALPTSTSKSLDRPFVRSSSTLGSAFDLWHAMLRAERILRLTAPARAAQLLDRIGKVKAQLSLAMAASDLDAATYARALVSDDSYGTLNILTAAAVLRSEIYPERSESSPSYLAGFILFAQLRLAAAHAKSHATTGLGDRPPRLALVSQAVHSLVLYVEHLRQRADALKRVAYELDAILALEKGVKALAPEELLAADRRPLQSAVNGALRLSLGRLQALCGRCEALILATRPHFEAWGARIDAIRRDRADVTFSAILHALPSLDTATDGRTAEAENPQVAAYKQAREFSQQLISVLKGISNAVPRVLAGNAEAASVTAALEELQRLLTDLERLHVGESGEWPHPSIRDAVRFQFLKSLVEAAATPARGKGTATERQRAQQMLGMIADRFLSESQDRIDWQSLLPELGRQAVGKALAPWWETLALCYEESDSWLATRHLSYTIIERLKSVLAGRCDPAKDSGSPRAESPDAGASDRHDAPSGESRAASLSRGLQEAASVTEAVALEIELGVKQLTQWCSPLGQQLLLAHQTGQPGLPMDPLELVSALWVADRLGEPWPEALEDIAFGIIAQVQRPDGGFPAVTPLYDHRSGFAYFAPSASTIGCLARFAGRGGRTPADERERRRLFRWEPVLAKGTEFLLNSAVLRDGERAGWHSDRYPAQDRIDSVTTTEAVKALCRIDDVLRWLINLVACWEFEVKWPEKGKLPPLSTDVGKGPGQYILVAMEVAESLRQRTSGYGGTRKPRAKGAANHSLLFYGPPGTGKTSLQEWVAADLGWPLVVITIGDFLKEGEGNIGKMAVAIFRQLAHVSNSCIVFDEFDEMVVDRGPRSDQGGGTRSASALLTPTVLPLLSELRRRAESQCCLVSFTTNYIASMDYAARRPGRVDSEFLLVYPDFESRLLLAIEAAASYEDAINIAQDCALCSLGSAKSYIAARVADGTVVDQRPAPAIQPDYYPSPLGKNHHLAREIKALIDATVSHGSDDPQQFFETPTGRPWRGPYQEATNLLFGAPAAQDGGRRAEVTIVLSGAPDVSGDDEGVFLVGAGILGDWAPEKALPLRCEEEGRWTMTQSWPAEIALEFKFILRSSKTPPRWEFGPDRMYKVATATPQELVLTWQSQ